MSVTAALGTLRTAVRGFLSQTDKRVSYLSIRFHFDIPLCFPNLLTRVRKGPKALPGYGGRR